MPALQGTLVAFVTPSGFPADIPLLEGERSFMGGTASQLQYAVRAKVPEAVEFYRREMAARGWAEGPTAGYWKMWPCSFFNVGTARPP